MKNPITLFLDKELEKPVIPDPDVKWMITKMLFLPSSIQQQFVTKKKSFHVLWKSTMLIPFAVQKQRLPKKRKTWWPRSYMNFSWKQFGQIRLCSSARGSMGNHVPEDEQEVPQYIQNGPYDQLVAMNISHSVQLTGLHMPSSDGAQCKFK